MQATSIKRGPVTIRAKNPVISGRVSESLLRKVRASAKKSGRSLSEELAFRADQSFAWEEAFRNAREVIDNAYRVTAGTLRQAMTDTGWRSVHTTGGEIWAPPEGPAAEAIKKLIDGMMRGDKS